MGRGQVGVSVKRKYLNKFDRYKAITTRETRRETLRESEREEKNRGY